MNRAAILRKIKACLRLAASPNANEAAAALRQAQAMMAAYGISHAEATDVREAEVGTRCRGANPTQSLSFLVSVVAGGFGAQALFVRTWGKTVIRFHGTDGAAEIAAYAFTVLRRQMDADRLKHIARVRKRGNREARGETFALAWVSAIYHLFPKAELAEEKRKAIEDLVRLRYPDATTGTTRDLTTKGKANDNDAEAGYLAGKAAQLHRAMKGTSPRALEHQS
ncbi:DUF7168 domain-containing protein [Frateuria sp. YIM B11624]|uniref:DUF7168 domain-containing protein n=1 Tax=Frateuria sp. YIM B11624 TaxID=3143185 RepID=UPI003C72264E